MTPGDLTWRDEEEADAAFVRRAHAAHAHWATMAALPAAMVTALRDQQYLAQARHLAAFHPGARKLIILDDGIAVGRLVVDRGAGSWHLVDLALVAEAQGSGIGTAVLRRLLADAARDGAGIVLEVGIDNPRAEAFYRGLGFVDAGGSDAMQTRLRWAPPATAP